MIGEPIPPEDYREQRRLYSRKGRGIWKIIGYCETPSITMQNVVTGEKENFGIHGAMAYDFKPIGALPSNSALEGESKR